MNYLKLKEEDKNNIQRQWIAMTRNLTLWEIRLIELRNWGMGYNEISDALRKEFKKIIGTGRIKSFNASALRNILSSEGKLHNAYKIYSEMIAEESLKEGICNRRNAHSLAVSTVIALLSKRYSGAVRLGASKDIQDRNEGKAVQKIEMQNNYSEVEELREKLKGIFN
ncbi:MAG: hypothetical protein A2271_02395 [Candidatus Moranbacteria bacterium RIFOXYA12_FULL_35_19]|nr:MAG: hypothetical protein UR78_C0008G0027 [Candidatus Moranbacteria bacterium GW2011_GWF2_35_39]OGI31923.1 MAG: hypothetical protein A2343_00895 [Candidatus Moranbacteria bacterium RIFOXYB12_FULL_35_8]OGI35389.1 MAG: hypothetical protein A2271_02395 [Candidatus Moranbacteria bacterium RIFOXYA12_FULL_35_19]